MFLGVDTSAHDYKDTSERVVLSGACATDGLPYANEKVVSS